jgi:hypothetical protein
MENTVMTRWCKVETIYVSRNMEGKIKIISSHYIHVERRENGSKRYRYLHGGLSRCFASV